MREFRLHLSAVQRQPKLNRTKSRNSCRLILAASSYPPVSHIVSQHLIIRSTDCRSNFLKQSHRLASPNFEVAERHQPTVGNVCLSISSRAPALPSYSCECIIHSPMYAAAERCSNHFLPGVFFQRSGQRWLATASACLCFGRCGYLMPYRVSLERRQRRLEFVARVSKRRCR